MMKQRRDICTHGLGWLAYLPGAKLSCTNKDVGPWHVDGEETRWLCKEHGLYKQRLLPRSNVRSVSIEELKPECFQLGTSSHVCSSADTVVPYLATILEGVPDEVIWACKLHFTLARWNQFRELTLQEAEIFEIMES